MPIKGLLDLITTVSELVQARVCNFTLDVMGHDDEIPEYAAECRRRAHDLGLDEYIRFRGNLNMAEVLGDFDALILPSYNEGQPLVVMEAMAVGLPVIGTHVGGMEQLILGSLDDSGQSVTGPCGILVRPGKVAELADAIYRLTSDQALYSSFSQNSRERISRYFTLGKAMDAYRLIYSELEMPTVPSIPAPRPQYHSRQLQPVGRHRQEDLEWQEWVARSLSPLGRADESGSVLPSR